jgi:hypothetical protein
MPVERFAGPWRGFTYPDSGSVLPSETVFQQTPRLTIENFRSIESESFEVPQICALVGPNNAG